MRALLLSSVACLACGALAPAAVPDLLDRIAVRVGKQVITEGEVLDEIRLTAFLNRIQPDFSPASRRQAAERLVDQNLIRQEISLSSYTAPKASEGDRLLQQLKKNRFPTDVAWRAALTRYGITEEELKEHLLWQITALRFTDARFGSLPAEPAALAPPPKTESSTETWPARSTQNQPADGKQTAARRQPDTAAGQKSAAAGQSSAAAGQSNAAPGDPDDQMATWLKDARTRTHIEFFPEAFE